MAEQDVLQPLLLLLVVTFIVPSADTINNERLPEYLRTTEHWSSVEDRVDDREENVHFTSGATVQEEDSMACRCWSAPADVGSFMETECKCHGQPILSVPSTLPPDLHRLTFYDSGLEALRSGDLQNYANTLTDFVVDKAHQFISIEEGAFYGLTRLQRIYIRRAPLLMSLPAGLFRLSLPSLHILLIKQTGLRSFPDLSGLETVNILHTVDLEENQLETIPTNSVRLRVDDFLISFNALQSIEAFAFNGSQIATLRFKGNWRLADVNPDAFMGLASLRRLDLSQTAVTNLPVRGLSELETLELVETKTLKEIPSVYNYQSLQVAHLTYPYHCCAFAFPATHDPEEHARHQHFIAEMQAKYCDKVPDNDSASLQSGDGNEKFGIDVKMVNLPDYEHDEANEVFHADPFQTPTNRELFYHAFCGNLTYAHREVRCTPQPDAFNPCEDILGTNWLRVAAWLVSVASVVGNLAVVLVLVQSTRGSMAVSKFLMVNLAIADLCMGFYLFLIVGMDVNTIGVYFNYAIDWQNGIGCQIAGFLTVFATELSVFTLVVITSERWYTITYAINLTRRLRLSTTAKIVALGWIVSFAMASLPLVGVSSYSTTSICLPLENHKLSDTIYLLVLLILNGIAFMFICLCYSHMYRSIRGNQQSLASHSDTTVAKKMALLVFTNFACWTPIAFFGLTAVAGYPLISVTHSKILLVFFYPLNACTNPYLYALVTQQYRRDLFLLLSRYGFCTERASRYRATFSFGRSFNNPVRAGSQLESVMQGGQLDSPLSATGQQDNPNMIRKKSVVSNGSAKRRMTPPLCKNNKGEQDNRQDTEMLPLSIPSVIRHQQIYEVTQEDVLLKPTNRLSLVLEAVDDVIYQNEDISVSKYQDSACQSSITARSTTGGGSVDSPHPIKHCQLHCNKGLENKVIKE
ncbi:hypothetical protein GHT06_022447 [Daphnia sinensis]|uniref:G-protein coupled receptors family 1 profile domain-containing protein n=1 Tax=Daphnia sinensis TaxID=1820382 RepID=A0AAD5KYP2_9CRUS|nr:hypothetical protein GHT06_022447 [Daphnia sinensis]